ncbi:haloacid dehalogenase type II [Geodermatophilus sp. SYSU D00691]
MAELRALVFDVFGTLVDWRSSLVDEARALGRDADWPAVVDDWRRAYQPALDREIGEPVWRDLDAVHRDTLDDVLTRHGIALGDGDRERLVRAWRRLRPWPDTAPGLERLRSRVRTATLSNGHVALLVDLLRSGGWRVDAVLSAELAGSYKPDPRVYRRGAELLGCAPDEVGMVAAHAGDLVAAAGVGLRPLFVHRPGEWGTGVPEDPPDLPGLVVADDLADLAAQLGC